MEEAYIFKHCSVDQHLYCFQVFTLYKTSEWNIPFFLKIVHVLKCDLVVDQVPEEEILVISVVFDKRIGKRFLWKLLL